METLRFSSADQPMLESALALNQRNCLQEIRSGAAPDGTPFVRLHPARAIPEVARNLRLILIDRSNEKSDFESCHPL